MRTINHPVSVQPAMPHRPGLAPRTAFVLASGASLGAMQVGMLRALYERGIDPDLSWAPQPAR
jgi:predicted acylesterase/phospholipase RssA